MKIDQDLRTLGYVGLSDWALKFLGINFRDYQFIEKVDGKSVLLGQRTPGSKYASTEDYCMWCEQQREKMLAKMHEYPLTPEECYKKPEAGQVEGRGLRYNKGKLQWGLVDWKSLEPMVKVLMFGAEKYSPDNWKKGLDMREILESMMRHLTALMDGEINDPETGMPHMGHIQCNAMFWNYMYQEGKKNELQASYGGSFGEVHGRSGKPIYDDASQPTAKESLLNRSSNWATINAPDGNSFTVPSKDPWPEDKKAPNPVFTDLALAQHKVHPTGNPMSEREKAFAEGGRALDSVLHDLGTKVELYVPGRGWVTAVRSYAPTPEINDVRLVWLERDGVGTYLELNGTPIAWRWSVSDFPSRVL